MTVLTFSAVVAVSVVTATPLKLNPVFVGNGHPDLNLTVPNGVF